MYKSLSLRKKDKGLPIALMTNKEDDKDSRVVYLLNEKPLNSRSKTGLRTQKQKNRSKIGDSETILPRPNVMIDNQSSNNTDLELLKDAIEILNKHGIKLNGIPSDNTSNDIKEPTSDDGILEIKNDNYNFFPIPNKKLREVLYIVGPSGSGKSFFSAEYIKLYQELFPDNPVYLVSSKPEDEQLDDLGVERIDEDEILEEFEDGSDDYTEYADSLVIFDDIDSFRKTKYEKPVYHLRDKLLKNARSINTYVIATNHTMFESQSTKAALDEAHGVVLFPGGGADESIRNWFKRKAGLDKKTIDELMKIRSRWIYFNTHMPRYIIWQNGVRIL